jgi:mannose-6-phosphate isomerase-like protein (cupin superfamily)
MKLLTCALFASVLAAQPPVVIYSAKDIHDTAQKLAQKGAPFASEPFVRYESNYTMLAFRQETGSSEVHEKETDVFIIEEGSATLVSGGKLVNPKTQTAGEIRGTSIDGGERHAVNVGDVIEIQPGVPHQLLIEKGKPFAYFVVKVKSK